MEKSRKITKNKQEGITLIALIITIIVLLILAGVTIAQITGNENAMDKAVEARQKNDEGAELDAIKIAAVSAMSDGDNALISLENLKLELRKLPDIVAGTEVDALSGRSPWTVKTLSGKEYDITQNGQVTDSTPKPAGLYNDEGYTSWEKLIEDGVISVNGNGILTVRNINAINGDLIIIYDGSVTGMGSSFQNCSSLTSITIPDSVTRIGDSAFYNCSSLASIKIPDSVTSIGNNAFYNCSSLASISIPDSVTSIGNSAFYDCSSLASITIPEGITSIESGTFSGCSSLASISIPDSVTSIGNHTFYNCRRLTSIIIPDSVTSIANSAFYKCSSLTSITIPEGVTSIGEQAFSSCYNLISIIIPTSVTSIGYGAFLNCNSLTTVNYTGTQEQWAAITIGSNNYELARATKNYNYSPES